MQPKTALTIIPAVMMFVGLVFITIPETVNEQLFVDLDERATEIASAMRRVIGGTAIGIAVLLLSCRELTGDAARRVLLGYAGTGTCIAGSIIAAGLTSAQSPFPAPPIIMFFVLISIALLAARKTT